MVVRCTAKLLNLLGKQSVSLVDTPTSEDDWYANLIWVDRRKCLFIAHAGTLFSLFVADIRVSDLRPFERRIVDLLAGALLEEGLPIDALGRLEPSQVRLAKTASRHVLGVMNQMAFEIGWHVDQAGGLSNVEVDALNSPWGALIRSPCKSTGFAYTAEFVHPTRSEQLGVRARPVCELRAQEVASGGFLGRRHQLTGAFPPRRSAIQLVPSPFSWSIQLPFSWSLHHSSGPFSCHSAGQPCHARFAVFRSTMRKRLYVRVPRSGAQLRERDLADRVGHVSACRPGMTASRMVQPTRRRSTRHARARRDTDAPTPVTSSNAKVLQIAAFC